MYISPFDAPPTEPSHSRSPTTIVHIHPPPSPGPPLAPTQANDDVLSELLIAQLLEEDLRLLAQAQEAERIQLAHVLSQSRLLLPTALSGSREPSPFPSAADADLTEKDSEIALQMMVVEARLEGDAAYARELLRVQNAGMIADQQAAQKWAATEMKANLDKEFAKRLQRLQEEGRDINGPDMRDVERYVWLYFGDRFWRFTLLFLGCLGRILSMGSW